MFESATDPMYLPAQLPVGPPCAIGPGGPTGSWRIGRGPLGPDPGMGRRPSTLIPPSARPMD